MHLEPSARQPRPSTGAAPRTWQDRCIKCFKGKGGCPSFQKFEIMYYIFWPKQLISDSPRTTFMTILHQDGCIAPAAQNWRVQIHPLHPFCRRPWSRSKPATKASFIQERPNSAWVPSRSTRCGAMAPLGSCIGGMQPRSGGLAAHSTGWLLKNGPPCDKLVLNTCLFHSPASF